MRTRTRAALAALPLALTLALTGCGSDDGDNDNDVASANGETQDDGADRDDGSDAPLSEDEAYRQMLEFAQCLRDNGLDVKDPAPGEGIQLQIEGDPSKAEAAADAAMEACEDLSPPPPADAPDEDEVRENMLEYAKCMRDNGVEKFADPKPGEGINIDPDVVEDPDFEQAEQACKELFGGPDVDERQRSDA